MFFFYFYNTTKQKKKKNKNYAKGKQIITIQNKIKITVLSWLQLVKHKFLKVT